MEDFVTNDSYHDLALELAKTDGWGRMSASKRTMHCCIRLAERGEELPSIQVIRGIIGKGDARGILAGRKEAIRLLGERLRFAAGIGNGTNSASEVLAHAQAIWVAGVEHGRQEMAWKVAALEQELEQLRAWKDMYQAELAEVAEQIDRGIDDR